MSENLQPRMIDGLQAEFVRAEWSGKNTSGYRVHGKNVLIRMDECAEVRASGTIIPQSTKERMDIASETGCIYETGPEAFRLFDDGTRWVGDTPKSGDRVVVERYAGTMIKGKDGKIYRMMDYRAIAAVEMPDEPEAEAAAEAA